MSIRNLLLTLWMAGTLAAQSFIQMSDQFGMYTKNANFEHETVNFEFAIANACHQPISRSDASPLFQPDGWGLDPGS